MEFSQTIAPSRVALFCRENIEGAENDIEMAGLKVSNSLCFSSFCLLKE